jgi:hypothetical protein
VFVRILSTAFLVSALAAVPAAAQAQQGGTKSTTTTTTSGPVVTSDEVVIEGDSTPRPALPTINGDTGLWFVPTAEVMPKGKWSASVFRANYDRRQGLTDVNQIGFHRRHRHCRSIRVVRIVASGAHRSRREADLQRSVFSAACRTNSPL